MKKVIDVFTLKETKPNNQSFCIDVSLCTSFGEIYDYITGVFSYYDNFISHNDVFVVDKELYKIFNILKVIKDDGNINKIEFSEFVKSLINLLKNIETDDDYFPSNHIDALKELL